MKKLAILLSLFMLLTALCIPVAADDNDQVVTATIGNPTTHQFNEKNKASGDVANLVEGTNENPQSAELYVMYDEANLYIRLLADRRPNAFHIFFCNDFFQYGTPLLTYDCASYFNASTGAWEPYVDQSVSGARGPKVIADSVVGYEVENGYVLDITVSDATFLATTTSDGAARHLITGRDSVEIEVMLIGDNGERYAWNNTSANDFSKWAPANAGDSETRDAYHAGTLTFGAEEGDLIQTTPEPEPTPTVTVNGEASKDVTASTVYEEPDPVYSATIEWGAMEFAYTASTDSWAVVEEDGNKVTVTNTGNQSIDVTFEYDPAEDYSDIGGAFDNETATLDAEESVTATLTLTGALVEEYEAVVIGSVTVTLVPTPAAEA